MTKKERKENALRFYNSLRNSSSKKVAIVIERKESANPNINRCRFYAVPPTTWLGNGPILIADSVLGIEGCFIELLGNIKSCPQKTYWEEGFSDWLNKEYGFRITYNDGFVIMLEKI